MYSDSFYSLVNCRNRMDRKGVLAPTYSLCGNKFESRHEQFFFSTIQISIAGMTPWTRNCVCEHFYSDIS